MLHIIPFTAARYSLNIACMQASHTPCFTRNTLQHTAAHCNILQHTAAYCSTLQRTATHCNTLQHTVTHCSTLQHTVTHLGYREDASGGVLLSHCNTLQRTATHCNTPRIFRGFIWRGAARSQRGLYGVRVLGSRTATHCNTLQRAAKHCNTLHFTAIFMTNLCACKGA